MSNFNCEKCKAIISEGKDGRTITGCEHYPMDMRSLSEREQIKFESANHKVGKKVRLVEVEDET